MSPNYRPEIKLSIIMPVFNEDPTLAQAVHEVLSVDYPCDIELIVVDDGSTDNSGAIIGRIADNRVIALAHAANQGKGAALRSGLAVASGTHMLPFDADLEYVADDILNLLQPILRGRCDVVYGVRLFGCNTVYPSYWHAVGNRMLTRLANIMYSAWLSDLHTCLKLIPIDIIRSIRLRESGFGLDTEITAVLLRRGVRPFEVPVSYFSRLPSQGKKIGWRDAIQCLRILMWARVRRASSSWAVAEQPDAELPVSKLSIAELQVARREAVPLGSLGVLPAEPDSTEVCGIDAAGYAIGAAAD